MDVTAPFLNDMGLALEGVEELRAAFREGIDRAPWVFSAAQAERVKFLETLDGLLEKSISEEDRQPFWRWLRDTYTLAPADRPNWEMYEMFFFEWYATTHELKNRGRPPDADHGRWLHLGTESRL
ncbi:MAG TPA: hypothetical protein VNH18_17700 [Bryobacteraceae bacterium]|nr:hypothetical protein [Bryobacteraceae bacterium]